MIIFLLFLADFVSFYLQHRDKKKLHSFSQVARLLVQSVKIGQSRIDNHRVQVLLCQHHFVLSFRTGHCVYVLRE